MARPTQRSSEPLLQPTLLQPSSNPPVFLVILFARNSAAALLWGHLSCSLVWNQPLLLVPPAGSPLVGLPRKILPLLVLERCTTCAEQHRRVRRGSRNPGRATTNSHAFQRFVTPIALKARHCVSLVLEILLAPCRTVRTTDPTSTTSQLIISAPPNRTYHHSSILPCPRPAVEVCSCIWTSGIAKVALGRDISDMANDTSLTSRWRRNRSAVNLLQVAQSTPPPSDTTPNKSQPKLERAPSKMSLFSLFSRPKVEKARGHTEAGLDVPTPAQPEPEPEPQPVPPSRPKSALRLTPAPSVQQPARSRSSQMFRPMSLKPPSVKSQPGTWDPPPLFQAYAQAVKHATVQSCVSAPDVLLRTQSQRRQHDLMRERMDSHRDLSATLEQGEAKLQKSHKRLISNSVLHPSTTQLTNKIFVLTTSGK